MLQPSPSGAESAGRAVARSTRPLLATATRETKSVAHSTLLAQSGPFAAPKNSPQAAKLLRNHAARVLAAPALAGF